jgi:hypothetical protein
LAIQLVIPPTSFTQLFIMLVASTGVVAEDVLVALGRVLGKIQP